MIKKYNKYLYVLFYSLYFNRKIIIMKQKSHLPEEVAYVYYDLLLIIPAEHAEESVFKLFSLTVRNIVTPIRMREIF